MTFELSDLAWYCGELVMAYAIGFAGGALHRWVIQVIDKAK